MRYSYTKGDSMVSSTGGIENSARSSRIMSDGFTATQKWTNWSMFDMSE